MLISAAEASKLAAKPVTYGEGSRPPRGNYAKARADYTCDQGWAQYTPAEHALYARLYERQAALLPGLACQEFIDALPQLGASTHIPRFDELSERLVKATGWTLVAVPGLIPEEPFFRLLSERRFPVTHWLRTSEEFDYVVEPDIFHDLFGHVPLLFNPIFANYMQAYGAGGLKAHALGQCEMLSRLYWYTVEFGLIHTAQGMRAYGAGIISSPGELRHSVHSVDTPRLKFDLRRIMRTRYAIDRFQDQYFVIERFEELFEATAPDFTPLYTQLSAMPVLPTGRSELSERSAWALGEQELAVQLKDLPDWRVQSNCLVRQLVFKDFVQAMRFMNAMAEVAERLNHHPEWRNVYNRVDIRLTTHDVGNRISLRDMAFAQAVDQYLQKERA
jgi:phenylalanine-4-hydroxylase